LFVFVYLPVIRAMSRPPNIYATISEFNRAIDRREKEQMIQMAKRWGEVESRLSLYMQRHADALQARRDAGLPVSIAAQSHMETYKELMRQTAIESTKYQQYAEGMITAEQQYYAETGIAAAQTALQNELGAGVAFNRINTEAVQNMIGAAGDGSPLFSVLQNRAIAPDAVEGLQNALIEGVALGYSPRKTAKLMADGLAQGLTKALTIARTEQIRAYRTASLDQYRASGQVTQYQRHAAPSERTCLACIALDGKVYDAQVDFASHPNCRCFMTPVILGVDNPSRSTESWLERQDEKTQRAILGGHYDAYSRGVPLQDMVTVKDDPTWGNTISIVPLKDLDNIESESK